jgi:predicted transposase/invertase (TIGR01784 family)
MNTNKKYKNSVFTFLFNKPDILRELYCALEGITLPPDVPVTINTLEDVLFMEKMNDISFEIGGKLVVLIEHQSTINHNMALRLLMYIARVYEKIITDRNIYSTKMITIPQPEFFVLYNGKSIYPDRKTIRLSDMYESLDSLGLTNKETPALDLEVKVININEGKNEEIVKRCSILSEYSAFVAKVHGYEKEGHSSEESIKKAVVYCRNHDILKGFLEQNGKEAMNMLITAEWNWDDAKEVWQEEAREDKAEEIARNAFAKGLSVEIIHEITGLSIEKIERL